MTLSERLREAALERAETRGEHVDGFLLEPHGVIDLRVAESEAARASQPRPIPQLPEIGSVDKVDALYDERHGGRSLWRRGTLRNDVVERNSPIQNTAPTLTPEPEEDIAPRSSAARLSDVPLQAEIGDPVDLSDRDPIDPTITGLEIMRPTGLCPKCNGKAERDLWDRFSQTDYWSCNDCRHMWQLEHGG